MTVLLFQSQTTTVNNPTTTRAWTYGDLKERVASWAERQDVTALIPTFCDYAHQEICRRLRASVNSTTADLTINAESIDLPGDFAAARRLYIDLSPRRNVMFVTPEERADLAALVGTRDYPTHAAIEGDQLTFAPVFTATATGKLLYYFLPSGLLADSDSNVVLEKYPYLYLEGALAELFRYLSDDNAADRHESRFSGMIEAINASEAADALRPSNVTVSPSGWTV